MRRVIFNQKGGVGKSSITCNLAAISAHLGYKTLVVDLDPQGNSSHYLLGQPISELETSLWDFFHQELSLLGQRKTLAEMIHATPFDHLHVWPAHPELESLETKLESRYKMYKLRDALQKLSQEYTYIFIDTPPALNFFSRSALIAAERCLIPFDCDLFSQHALYNLQAAIAELKEDHNRDLQIEGIIVNQFNAQAKLPRQMIEDLQASQQPLLPVHLSASVKMRESHQVSQPLIQYAPKHKLTKEFVRLFEHLQNQ
ncbi:chromosome partitioning protein [Allopseudospirillum japonicum]|uniref:Chromosome partitioning protein n=1 Tax=Allopseudospirillum japonicum TaxID=64971 RepID=A0A1H6UCX6_9GAMM|nr:ParA family protein [Allopseudospirillum japonicum]SEI85702.1 chromosome partitioning protein [Allopseudospirillum japonicum]